MTQQPYNTMQSADGVSPEAGKARTTSLVLGIICTIFGVIAIIFSVLHFLQT